MTEKNPMETSSIKKLVWSYSIPAIVGMLVSALYNITDRIWVGRIPGTGGMALSAVGATLPFSTVLTACCAFIATGAATTMSTYLGKKETDLAEHTIGNTLFLTLIMSILYTVIGFVFSQNIMKWMGVSENIMPMAKDYLYAILLGSLFQFFSYTVAHTIRSTGNLKRYSTTIMLGAVLNIVLDPIFIFGFDMGIKGAAYATNISAMFSMIYGFSYYLTNQSPLKISFKNLQPKSDIIKSILNIGIVSFIFQLMLGFIGGFSNSVLSTYGNLENVQGGLNGLEIAGQVIKNGGDYGMGSMAVVMSMATLFLMPVFGIV